MRFPESCRSNSIISRAAYTAVADSSARTSNPQHTFQQLSHGGRPNLQGRCRRRRTNFSYYQETLRRTKRHVGHFTFLVGRFIAVVSHFLVGRFTAVVSHKVQLSCCNGQPKAFIGTWHPLTLRNLWQIAVACNAGSTKWGLHRLRIYHI